MTISALESEAAEAEEAAADEAEAAAKKAAKKPKKAYSLSSRSEAEGSAVIPDIADPSASLRDDKIRSSYLERL